MLVEFVGERIARAAGAVIGPVGVFGIRIAALDHEILDDAVETGSVVEFRVGELEEVLDRDRGGISIELDGDVAEARVKDGAVVLIHVLHSGSRISRFNLFVSLLQFLLRESVVFFLRGIGDILSRLPCRFDGLRNRIAHDRGRWLFRRIGGLLRASREEKHRRCRGQYLCLHGLDISFLMLS